jgi:DNA-binding response OmpR family regulator
MTILIIDDERAIRKALSFALQKQGHEIIEMENPLKAIELLNVDDINLIIIDLNMPFISGTEFIRIIKEKGQNIPTIILSSQHESINKTLLSQIDPIKIISKDLSLQQILKYLKNYL